MRLLVCGMHRSGTSAMARLAAAAASWTLLDDPAWAIKEDPLSYRQNRSRRTELVTADIVKCPRMSPLLPAVLGDFPYARAVFMLRDPRDIWRSIQEKVRLGRPTRMLRFAGIPRQDVPEALRDAYLTYVAAIARPRDAVRVLPYDVFFVARPQSARLIAAEAGGEVTAADLSEMADRQLGPTSHKAAPGRIAGPSRWRREPAADADAVLAPAVDAYRDAYVTAVSRLPSTLLTLDPVQAVIETNMSA